MTENNLEVNPTPGPVLVPQQSSSKARKDSFTPLKSIVLLLITLLVSVGGWYAVGKYYIWTDIDMKRVNAQLDFYKQKVQEEPNNARTRVELGYTYFIKGKNSEAIQEFNQALVIDPKNFDGYYNLGVVLLAEKRYNEALEKLNKAVELSPRDYKGHLQKGIAYRNLKMYKEARDSLTEANKLMPTNAEIIFETGRVAEDQGEKNLATEIYKEVLKYDPLFKPAIDALTR